jgi:DNA-binding CsgD family transcriptional regulator
MVAIDEAMVVRAWTDSAAELLGVSARQAIGRHCYDVLSLETKGGALCGPACGIAEALRRGTLPSLRNVKTPSNGRPRRSLSMLTFACEAPQGPMLFHAFQPLEPAPASSGRSARALTPRQLEILRMLDRGLMSKQIATELGISKHTVNNHVQAILRTLKAPTRMAALARARELHLL